jgi:site-specific DNA-cytosine methylase
MINPKVTAVGLFAGAGGLDLGFRSAGFETVAAFDISEAAVAK